LSGRCTVSLQAPFPWFGGKSPVAPQVWAALGDCAGYVEPFFGSGAVLLARGNAGKLETVNDLDGLLANFWRAVKHDAAAVADAADWPVNEADLHARHLWLVGRRTRITERLMGDPEFFDAKAAGWWLWGACAWIGSGWCSGVGPWIAQDGVMVDSRKLPHLSEGRGVNRRLPHLSEGRGVNRQLPHLGRCGQKINAIDGVGDRRRFIIDWIDRLSLRLRDVRVACGDWTRVTGPSVLRAGAGICGAFLDPPYDVSDRADVYAAESKVAPDVRQWCAANGDDPALRIVLAGYDGEHNELTGMGWRVIEWKARGGYASQGDGDGRANAKRERLWLSPHCHGVKADLFSEFAA
jgi:hypothetical protein